jgi:signal transduction histidine kinase
MTLLVLVLTLIVTIIVVERTVKPMRQIALASKSFAKGNYSVRVPLPKYKYGGELYELAAAFNNMADAFENVEMTRRGLVANVAHDLRTPMTTIAGFVDGILDGTIKPDKQEYYLRIVSDEVKRLSRMASSILEMSRLESGERALNLSMYDITETVRRIIISFEQKISQKNIELELDIPDRINVVADHDAMFQVIYNLVDNALKFVEEGGRIIIYMSERNSELQFNIINTGGEIAKEDIRYIFDRFYKGDRSRTGSASGSGLGLYIVKTVVNRHGGDVFARSENNTTEFCFKIPTKADNTQESKS